MISQTGGSSGLYGTIWIIENRQDIGRCPAFHRSFLKRKMSDEMSDEKGWAFDDFCPLYAPKVSQTRKDTGHLIFSAYSGKK